MGILEGEDKYKGTGSIFKSNNGRKIPDLGERNEHPYSRSPKDPNRLNTNRATPR